MDPGEAEEPDREELASRVDQLEETVSKMLPSRRGVLTAGAGLGLGALLSGSATAQSAAGQVGTEASPVDVFAYDLDVQGALQSDLDAGGQAITNAGSVSTDKFFNADVGELQSKLGNATAGDTVRMRAGETYDPGSETTIPQGVTLDFNGAELRPTSDYNGLFLEAKAKAHNVFIQPDTTSYTSDYIQLSTARAGKYNIVQNSGVAISGEVRGRAGGGATGTGLHLIDDASTQADTGISIGNQFDLTLFNCHVGVHGDILSDASNDPFINGPRVNIDINDCVTGVLHTGNGPFVTTFNGDLQAGSNSETGIENQTTETSITWDGIIWDTFNFGSNTLSGPNITNITTNAAGIKGTTDNADGQLAVDVGGIEDGVSLIELEGNTTYSYDTAAGQLIVKAEGNTIYRVLDEEAVRFDANADTGYIYQNDEDLSQRTPSRKGEIAADDGTNTSSGYTELAIGQGVGGSWFTMGGDLI